MLNNIKKYGIKLFDVSLRDGYNHCLKFYHLLKKKVFFIEL